MTALVKLYDLPQHLQFNPYILTGYRKPINSRQCISSLCYWHNESFNIYSHTIAFVYFMFSFYQYSQIWSTNQWTIISLFIIINYIVSCLPFALSIIYHLFMCHKNGPETYQTMLKIDVLGIWIMATFGELHIIYITLYCYPRLQVTAIISYFIVSLSVLSFLLAAKTKKIRTKAFALQYIFRIIILLVRLSKYGCGHHYTHIYYIMMEAFCGSAAIMNALHIPERWFPGKLDYIFNGHTLMHIFTTFGMALSRKGFLLDVEWMSRTPQCL